MLSRILYQHLLTAQITALRLPLTIGFSVISLVQGNIQKLESVLVAHMTGMQ